MSSIYTKKTGRFIPINKVGRGYAFDMWIPIGRQDPKLLNTVTEGDKTILRERTDEFKAHIAKVTKAAAQAAHGEVGQEAQEGRRWQAR